jgi:hypothetical protein
MPRNPAIDISWTNPASQPRLGDLRPFYETYDFGSAVCASDPEQVVVPLSRGHNDDHKSFLSNASRLRDYLDSLPGVDAASRIHLSAHSGGGSVLALSAPFENLPVERIKLLDATYSEEASRPLVQWLAMPHLSRRLLEVHSVTEGTAVAARKMRLEAGPTTRDDSGVRLQRIPGASLKVEVHLSGAYDHYSIVPARFVNAPDPGQNILIVGDSHSAGTFGMTLDRLFRKSSGNQVRTVASCGSIIRWWYTGQATPCGFLEIPENGARIQSARSGTPLIQKILASKRPEVVIVELGANYLIGYPEAALRNDVTRLLGDIQKSNARCIWVGPPHMRRWDRELDHWVPLLRSLVEKSCLWIDSRSFTRYPETGGDGVHYEAASLRPLAEKWAGEIHRVINENHAKP